MTDILGSPLYMAPEILLKKSYGSTVDIWAAGVLLHILMVGEPPFIADSKKEIFNMIRKQEVVLGKGWSNFSPFCRDIVAQMLIKDPKERPSAEKLLKHPWFEILQKETLDTNDEKAIEIAKNLEIYMNANRF